MPIQPKPRNEREAIELQQKKDRETVLCLTIDSELGDLVDDNPNGAVYSMEIECKTYYNELSELLKQHYNQWAWKIFDRGEMMKPRFRIEFRYKD